MLVVYGGSQTHGLEEHVYTSELIKCGILALVVVLIAVVARRGQAHSAPRSTQEPDHVTESDTDSSWRATFSGSG